MQGTRIAIVVVVLIGLAFGIGAYTFIYAKGASYLTTDPAACANCHVMQEHFDAWQKSSHRNVATCSDCHMPHDLVGKYTEKATNGFLHSLAFTTGRFPDPIQIRPVNRAVTEAQCRHCHATITEAIEWGTVGADRHEAGPAAHRAAGARPQVHDGIIEGDRLSCIRCHTYVGHWVR
ncbi:MAG TPA: cytochrome c nitrite reductase small subunit [Gemmatimonadales bacterium]|nr:cytochrome c nitrite reductase small subunit [Gemmatimonadales bacterium]